MHLLGVQACHLVSAFLGEDNGEDSMGPGRCLIHVCGRHCPAINYQSFINNKSTAVSFRKNISQRIACLQPHDVEDTQGPDVGQNERPERSPYFTRCLLDDIIREK